MPDRPILFSAPMVRALLAGRKTQTRRVLASIDTPRLSAPYHPERREARHWVFMQRTDLPGYAFAGADFNVPFDAGDRLWVREAWAVKRFEPCLPHERDWQSLSAPTIRYLADGAEIANPHGNRTTGKGIYHGPVEKGRPSIHMPRWASRLTLTVIDVRVQRLQDISEADAIAEGLLWQEPTDEDREWAAAFAEENGGDPNIRGAWIAPGTDCGFGPKPRQPLWGPTAKSCFQALWSSINTAPGKRWEDNPWVVALSFTVERRNIDGAER